MEAIQAKVAALEAENAAKDRRIAKVEAENFSQALRIKELEKEVKQLKARHHGEGTYTLANGAKYVGQWKDGEMHGFGKLTRPDGQVAHDGEWENGQPKK